MFDQQFDALRVIDLKHYYFALFQLLFVHPLSFRPHISSDTFSEILMSYIMLSRLVQKVCN